MTNATVRLRRLPAASRWAHASAMTALASAVGVGASIANTNAFAGACFAAALLLSLRILDRELREVSA